MKAAAAFTVAAAIALAPPAIAAEDRLAATADDAADETGDETGDETAETAAFPADAEDRRSPPASPRHVIPDLSADLRPRLAVADDLFTIAVGVRIIFDNTVFTQDETNLAQVGRQHDTFELRSLRAQAFGTIGRSYQVRYRVAAEYRGFETQPEQNWQLTDFSLTFPIGHRHSLAVGKIREAFSYEAENSVPNLPQAERILSPFFVTRNLGARMTHVLGPTRAATLSYGMFNRDFEFGNPTAGGLDFSARATGLVWEGGRPDRFLHLGAAWRRVGSAGSLRYRGRPESNVADAFVDTGEIAAGGADHFGAEALLNLGSVSLLGEVVVARVDAPTLGNPRLGGWYLVASWVPTGESRPYDRNLGLARRIEPLGRWGAPELVLRFSHVDLDDRGAAGGRFDRLWLGANWWASGQWSAGIGWGRTWLDRFGTRGTSDSVLTRVQWIY